MSTHTSRWWRRKTTIAALAGAGLFTLGCSFGGDLVSYDDLPEEEQRYTLEVETDGVTTAWEYTSGTVAEGDSPEQQPCMGEALGDPSLGECRPEPLIFLKYDLNLALDDTVPANEVHTITVTGYYEERLSDPPEVTQLELEASFDGGSTWQQGSTEPSGDSSENSFTATVPAVGDDVDTVWLRVSATDSDGNTVVQTMPDVYTIN